MKYKLTKGEFVEYFNDNRPLKVADVIKIKGDIKSPLFKRFVQLQHESFKKYAVLDKS
jgi:hypothetical protein